jgi:hypothetical protein
VLDEQNNVVPARDAIEWASLFEDTIRCRVAFTEWPAEGERAPFELSTIFVGLNMRHFSTDGPPIVFEMALFERCADGARRMCEQERFSTWQEALAAHRERAKKINAERPS